MLFDWQSGTIWKWACSWGESTDHQEHILIEKYPHCLPNSFLPTLSNMHCCWIIDYVISLLDATIEKALLYKTGKWSRALCVRLVVMLSRAGTGLTPPHLGLGPHLPPWMLRWCSGCVEQTWDERSGRGLPPPLVWGTPDASGGGQVAQELFGSNDGRQDQPTQYRL